MKITRVRSYSKGKTCIVRVDTDEGVSGFGMPSGMNNEALHPYYAQTLVPRVLGLSVFDAETIEERCLKQTYKFAGQMLAMAYSGLDVAIWDAKARFLGQPIYNLLGGRYRDQMQMYGSSMTRDLSDADEAAKVADAVRRCGFRCVKIKTGPRLGNVHDTLDLRRDASKVRAVREAIGPDVALIVDGNSSYTVSQALALYEMIAPYEIEAFEEPCPYDDLESYVRLKEKLPIAIDVGEQDWNLYTFRNFIAQGAVQICAADVIKCGGFLNAKRVAALCRAHGIVYSPHDTTHCIGMAANLHVVTSSPECNAFQEYSIETFDPVPYIDRQFTVRDGMLSLSDRPGLGFEIDEDYLNTQMQCIDYTK